MEPATPGRLMIIYVVLCGRNFRRTSAMPKVLNANHRTNRLLAVLEPEDFALLEPHFEVTSLSRGQVLYEPGDMIGHVYFPHDAMISLVNVMEDGAINEVALFGREEVVGASTVRVMSVVANSI